MQNLKCHFAPPPLFKGISWTKQRYRKKIEKAEPKVIRIIIQLRTKKSLSGIFEKADIFEALYDNAIILPRETRKRESNQ